MGRALILLCLLSAGAFVHSLGTIYKVPSIYTPVASGGSYLQVYPPKASPSPSFSPYPSPYPALYPPNSFILVYYRAKPAPAPVQLGAVASVTPQPQLARDVCKGEGITAHPTDCYKFLRCRLSPNQQVFYYEVRSCPQGLAFDASLESCNYQARVSNCVQSKPPRRPSSTKTAPSSKTSPPFPTQTLLTYHNDLLPKSTKETDKQEDSFSGEDGSSSPSLYMLDLPQPLLDLDENHKQEQPAEATIASSEAPSPVPAAKLDKVECDCEKAKVASPAPTKKAPSSRKSPTTKSSSPRKASPKVSPVKGTKAASDKPPVQQAKPARKQARVETFSIGDSSSSESAKMVLAKEEPTGGEQEGVVASHPVAEQAAGKEVDKLVAGVSYEDSDRQAENGDDDASDLPAV